MKRIVEKVKTHRKVVHAHLKKHHKKYLFGVISAALLIKIIPAFIAWLATWHFNYSFADSSESSTEYSTWWEIDCYRDGSGNCYTPYGTYTATTWENKDTITFSGINLQYSGDMSVYFWTKIIVPEAVTGTNIGSWRFGTGTTQLSSVIDWTGEDGRYFIYYRQNLTTGDILENFSSGFTTIEKTVEASWNGTETQTLTINIDINNIALYSWIIDSGNIDFKVENWQLKVLNWETIIRTGSCTWTIPDNAVQITWHWEFMQTKSWDDWTPETKEWTYSWAECWFICSGGYLYDENSGLCLESPVENNTCDEWSIVITLPSSWESYQTEAISLNWILSGSACSGKTFAIKLYNGNDSGSYTLLWTVSANSGSFTNLENFNISGFLETNFAIYLVEDDEIKESVKQGPTFFIDNIKPEIISASYIFNPARTTTFGLNDTVNIIFTWSEELTGITVNVLWRNATFVSKSWLTYNYSIQLSSWNNTWQFEYHISFRDLAWNTWSFDDFNTWLTLDATKPELSGLEFRRISWVTWFVSFATTKPSNITFKYVLSWWKATETLTASNSTEFRSNLAKARTDRSNYIYKYVITLEDMVWNKSYYAGTFQLSWDSIWYTLVTSNGSVISTGNTTTILSALSNELNAYSWCKGSLWMHYESIQYMVQDRFLLKAEMPQFSSSTIENSAKNLVALLVGTWWLSKSTITWLTQTKVNNFQRDLNNYLVVVKLKRDPDVCDFKFSLLPSLYMAKFLKTLKSYKIIR